MNQDDRHTKMMPDHAPRLPIIYLDWNTTQHLRKEASLNPLLHALAEARLARAALTPYSNAHLMDASAGWTELSDEHRAERLRDLTFLEGLSSGWLWTVEPIDGSDHHHIVKEPPLEACHARGQFRDLRADVTDASFMDAANEQLRTHLDATIVEMRRITAEAPNVPKDVVESMISAMTDMFASGLANVSDAGTMFTKLLAPAMLHAAESLPGFNDVPPEKAVAYIVDALRNHDPNFDLLALVDAKVASEPGRHVDDLGPMTLAWLGYERDKARDIRRGAPGLVPDQTHARYALSSAIFLSGERRLPRRIQAWAAHTGRGAAHETWPLVLQVTPHDLDSIASAVATVREYAATFAGEVDALWQPQPDESGG